ncbi:hypothetical protein LTR47_011500 [Exophiala xenobiotica]|nr:hypothetical protein LTR72_011926 [Exophiala xenobiotica]KAK5219353.1 hypothetical protein LTR47_011500 [Exophiala xenobiotica]KAK5243803.1 hypothetical protein LTS06_010514 [Exophiala xenobiotica]KAK5283067.1 hypothetical protein LTR40_002344 [Exophiala xenobiotica]KAK5283521.1 hypothetical protein LTR14_011866 [Exophiala xenobiotica]
MQTTTSLAADTDHLFPQNYGSPADFQTAVDKDTLMYGMPTELSWPQLTVSSMPQRNLKIKSCFDRERRFPGQMLATVTLLDIWPKVTVDLSETTLRVHYNPLVAVYDALTFVMMDDGMVYGLCHPHLQRTNSLALPLHELLLIYGKPMGKAKALSPSQLTVMNVLYNVNEFEQWRASQRLIYLHLEGYGTYLHLLSSLYAEYGMRFRVSVDKGGKLGLPAYGEVDAAVENFIVSGTENSGTFVTGTFSYGEHKVELRFKDYDYLAVQGIKLLL